MRCMKMEAIIVYLLILATGGSLAEMLTPAERNKAWVSETKKWIQAVGNWKKSVEANCNVSDADQYWREAFACPDVSGVTCQNYDAREVAVDELGCSTTVCRDGLYTDHMAFLDMWRQHFNTYKMMMSIWGNKLVDCACAARKCLDSDAVTLEAWNSQSLKYSELSIALLEAKGEIDQLQDKTKDLDAVTENYSQLSSAVSEAGRLMAKLENQTQDWDAMNHKYEKLSVAVLTANDQIEGLQNKSEERYSSLSSAMTKANERIDQLQNNSETHTQTYTELSNSLIETKEQVEQLHGTTGTNTSPCPIEYNRKCFWIIHRDPHIKIVDAEAICAAKGGRLANIYSETHHYMLLRYLRLFGDSRGYARAWIGMKQNTETMAVSLSDGTAAPFLKWYRTYPQTGRTINMYMIAQRDWDNTDQNILNSGSGAEFPNAICEK